MIPLLDIERFLNQTLQPGGMADYCPNGVQVRGRPQVSRVVTGVSACLTLFQEAEKLAADLILVHHGLFWDREPRVVENSLKTRLKFLLERDVTLMAYHLPLDCHPELGNNAQILEKLALRRGEPFGVHRGVPLSWMGWLEPPVAFDAFCRRVADLFGGQPLVLPFGPPLLGRVAVMSGAAPDLIREAKSAGADLFLTGEAAQPVFHFAEEEGIHFIAAGHHRTEGLGVQALGAALAQRFGIAHHHVDVANPI